MKLKLEFGKENPNPMNQNKDMIIEARANTTSFLFTTPMYIEKKTGTRIENK